MNILYVSSTRFVDHPYRDPSTRYRCFNIAEVLNQRSGLQVDVVNIYAISTKQIARYNVVVFHRPIHQGRLQKLINYCKAHNILAVADYDDLIFDPDFAHISPLYLNSDQTLESVKRIFRKNRMAFELFDYFTVSTAPLRKWIYHLHGSANVALIRNGLSQHWLKQNNQIKNQHNDPFVITYLPGSKSHDADFRLVEKSIAHHLNANPTAILKIVGDLNFNRSLFRSKQLVRIARVPYKDLPSMISSSSVTIAPLSDNFFNQCKSGIKFIESAAFSTPYIGTTIEDVSRHVLDEILCADTKEDWSQFFELLQNGQYKQHIGETIKNYVRKNCMCEAQANELVYTLKSWLGTNEKEHITTY